MKQPEQESHQDKEANMCMLLLKKRLHFLPVITAVFIITSLFISYGVSVGHGHVEPDFPYISHTAIQIPERCIFGQLINMGAVLLATNAFVRFLQQRMQFKPRDHQGNDNPVKTDRRLCIAALVVGLLSALGLSMVANFQTIEMRPPHYVGAGLAFGFGLVYCWIQTAISLRHPPLDCVTVCQLINSIILSICLVTFGISKTIFKIQESRGGRKEVELRPVYLVSTISEWLTAVAVVLFVLTFYRDFSKLTLKGPRVYLKEERAQRTANGHANHNSVSHTTASPIAV